MRRWCWVWRAENACKRHWLCGGGVGMVEREGKEKGVETRLHGCWVECCLSEGKWLSEEFQWKRQLTCQLTCSYNLIISFYSVQDCSYFRLKVWNSMKICKWCHRNIWPSESFLLPLRSQDFKGWIENASPFACDKVTNQATIQYNACYALKENKS